MHSSKLSGTIANYPMHDADNLKINKQGPHVILFNAMISGPEPVHLATV